MSVDLCVFIHQAALPTCEGWQRAIQERGHDFTFEEFSTRDHLGFVPIRWNGAECGFEYSFCEIENLHEEAEDVAAAIQDRSHIVTLTIHASELDSRAAELAASVLASLTNGVYLDPQGGSLATGNAVFEMLVAQHEAERERRLAEAERKWANVTERRCPECNARCPEYRGRCWVCEFAIGKVPG